MSKFHYIIDNGHGYNTPGKRSPVWDDGRQLLEFCFNRDIVFNLSILLKESDVSYDILVPEMKDIPLWKRCRRANKIAKEQIRSCIFISIHGNGIDRYPSANGIETYHHPKSKEGSKIAKIFQNNLIEETGWGDRGVKFARFKVLRSTNMPAILTENGFYTNYLECRKMMQDLWKKRIAYAHYKSILKYEQINL